MHDQSMNSIREKRNPVVVGYKWGLNYKGSANTKLGTLPSFKTLSESADLTGVERSLCQPLRFTTSIENTAIF